MMIDTIKKFVKYGVFESTTNNYDYAIVEIFSISIILLTIL